MGKRRKLRARGEVIGFRRKKTDYFRAGKIRRGQWARKAGERKKLGRPVILGVKNMTKEQMREYNRRRKRTYREKKAVERNILLKF